MNRTLALSASIKTATNKSAAHTVDGAVLQKIPYGNIDNLAPAGSISSSVADMSKWVLMQLNEGMHLGQQLFPASALAQTKSPHSILGDGGHPFNKAHFNLYGLGWLLEEYAGRKIVAHTGGVNGFVTSVYMVPEEQLGIIVLTNTDVNGFFEALRNEIQDAYLGLPYRDYSGLFAAENSRNQQENAKSLALTRDTIAMKKATALPMAAYTGEYVHAVYGKMNIKWEGDQLMMRFEHHKGRYATLKPLGGNRFFCEYNEPLFGKKKLAFKVAGKKVVSLTVRVADFVEFTTYDFIKVK